MKRVVITGYGIVSCLGNNKQEVLESLLKGRSGIRFNEEYKKLGFRSQVSGFVNINTEALIDRKVRRFMGETPALTYIAMKQAIEQSGLTEDQVSHPRTGLVVGSGGASSSNIRLVSDTLLNKGAKRVMPYMVTKCMASSISACLASPFKIKGLNYSITSACSTSAHCIGHGYEQIQFGKQDIIFAGGGEEQDWAQTVTFDAMAALSSKYNDKPETASRPFDATRDGFVIANGGGVVVLEELEHALKRKANIYAEIVGYAATSDGLDMVVPSGDGAVRCMRQALSTVSASAPIDYINTHGTATPAGDMVELKAIKEVFGEKIPWINSTKSLSGHSLGATGVHEAIYSLLMMENNFISATANLQTFDEEAKGMPIVTETKKNVQLNTILSNSFGFGGTNGCLIFQRYSE
ncbi:beta-ketoacyl-ACP synthase I [candidate division KSB1 bacterium]|nr:beta-ketoacyl-ACP synthase I [candidate division KSB1 bacterium]MBL7094531.1 beta-ketoacyl-ACP synthase I [candidate division KSB1 bacterium]